ncbi:3-hydroxyacyl-[acyl-carrier-protein] dehydratase [Maribacter vaceletii]|uniref:3-hydroxyacyl-[acyl-carrier-protein] dehydratase n=1 Tax=Maribacter vaceletii TaxID=1206816 RepID=A0A495EC95_9FLAO|nr:3-hydroxyacyl-ACP dehydratase [Maribacter vaceletii]RKR14492.1 3-hydroxyacyl-[acyl-carrier-protein] dehydratase [Maribacter vaceletii]
MLIEGLYSVENLVEEEATVNATIKIYKEHDIFKGHFPGNPVMPGVCMIQIIKELTEKATGKQLFLSVSSNIKFMAIINPEKNDTLNLTLAITEVEDTIKVKNTTSFEETLALKLSATFKIIS